MKSHDVPTKYWLSSSLELYKLFFSLICSISMCFLIYIKHVKTWGVTLAQRCIVTLLKLCIPSVTSAVLRPQSVQKNWGRVHPRCWKCAASEGAASAASDLLTRPVLSTLHQRGTGMLVWPAQKIYYWYWLKYIYFPLHAGVQSVKPVLCLKFATLKRFHINFSLLLMMHGAVHTVSSFSKAASNSACGPCQTSSYFTWNASDRCKIVSFHTM